MKPLFPPGIRQRAPRVRPQGADTPITPADAAFLDDLEQRCCRYFWECADPVTGLVADRARADGSASGEVSSIAASGFGLAALAIAESRGWLGRAEAAGRVAATLRFIHDHLPHEHGFYHHFIDRRNGQCAWNCEVSSIDTALLLAGVLTVRQAFAAGRQGMEIQKLAGRIFDRVDWPWMLAGGSTLCMGWKPRGGFLPHRWDQFSEHLFMYLMAMGSTTHALPAECWHAWHRGPVVEYAGRSFMSCPPLFVHQYPHAWIDFRGLRDGLVDYWRNSVEATLAHRQFCIDLARTRPRRFGHYGPNLWGISASDSVHGYRAWGGPPATPGLDGTVVPCAAAGSLPFAPAECLDVLQHMRSRYGRQVWRRYGFVDAFNPRTGWVNPDVIGIDLGITLLMAENLRSGLVWRWFGQDPLVQRGMAAAGFTAAEAAA